MLCKKCKNPEEFSANHKVCKKCRAKAGRKYYARPSVKKAKQFYHKQRRTIALNAYRLKTYGITPEKYESMVRDQDGKCAICNNKMNRLCIDHCHVTGKIRKLLCDRCNQGLGLFRDNVNYLLSAAKYLQDLRA